MNIIYNDLYKNIYGKKINESTVTDISNGNTSSVAKIKNFPMYATAVNKIVEVDLGDIVNCVNDAIAKLSTEYPFMYKYIKWSRPQYVLGDPGDKRVTHKTMAVDNEGNLWMNVHFIYNSLNCDVDKIFGILFHELMHNFLNHLERASKVKSEAEMEDLYRLSESLGENEHAKQNICMDYEVNGNMVADGVVSANFWKELRGCFDEKYIGKMWEEIYYSDGNELLTNYLKANKQLLPKEYFEIVDAILEAMKVLRNPKSTEKEKDIAKSKVEDLLMKLTGDTTRTKMSIRKALQKLQGTRIKEVGEIGPYLKDVVDDLMVSPRNMGTGELRKFTEHVNTLGNEMLDQIDGIANEFENLNKNTLEKDIYDFAGSLIDGVSEISKNKDITAVEMEEITDNIIYNIDKLLSDNIKKKKLAEEKKKRDAERAKKKEELRKKKIEELKKRHNLYMYSRKLEDLSVIQQHGRMSDATANEIDKVNDIVKKLLDEDTVEKTKVAIEKIGLPVFENAFDSISDLLYKDLSKLRNDKVIISVDDKFLKECCEKFKKDNISIFKSYIDGISNTLLIGKIKNAITSIRRIGKLLHTQKRTRPTKDYREGYNDEYKKLHQIYKELGEKGLKKYLGIQ